MLPPQGFPAPESFRMFSPRFSAIEFQFAVCIGELAMAASSSRPLRSDSVFSPIAFGDCNSRCRPAERTSLPESESERTLLSPFQSARASMPARSISGLS